MTLRQTKKIELLYSYKPIKAVYDAMFSGDEVGCPKEFSILVLMFHMMKIYFNAVSDLDMIVK